ncbi:MAG: LapA family protein [Acidobacteria bacterium]|nr:MAG: LapA family protein [Acidobacteriota bacterium]
MRNLKLTAVLLLSAALVIVALQNREPVEIHFLFTTTSMPQVLLLFLTAAGGFCVGLLVALLAFRRRKGRR